VLAGGLGRDALNVDLSSGNPIPAAGVTFDGDGDGDGDGGGGGGAGGDTLAVLGSASADVASFDAGRLLLNGSSIDHADVEAFVYDGSGAYDSLVLNAGHVLFPSTQTFDSLTVNDGASAALAARGAGGEAGADKLLVVRALSLTGDGVLDLANQSMLIDYDVPAASNPIGSWDGLTYDGVTGMIARGYNFGAWDGSGLVTSMADAAAGITGLSVGEAADAFFLSGDDTTTWNGQAVDATMVIVTYTYAGDVNLDGVIDGADYGTLDNW